MPGRSWTTTPGRPFIRPSFFSTVTPGQLPTYWLPPVSSLKSVVLPQFGSPARAILTSRESSAAAAGAAGSGSPGAGAASAFDGSATSTISASARRIESS